MSSYSSLNVDAIGAEVSQDPRREGFRCLLSWLYAALQIFPITQRSNNIAGKSVQVPETFNKGTAGAGTRFGCGESGSWSCLPVLVRERSIGDGSLWPDTFWQRILRIAFALMLSTPRHPEVAPRYSSNKPFRSSRAISDVSMLSFTLGQDSLIAIPRMQGLC